MLDIKFIRENKDAVKKNVADRQMSVDVDKLLDLDEQRRVLVTQIEALRAEQNKAGEDIAMEKADVVKQVKIEKMKGLKTKIAEVEPLLAEIEKELNGLFNQVPNVVSPDTPVGKNGSDNVERKKWGEAPEFDFEPKDYMQLANDLDIVDFERGTKVAGYRGYYLKNEGAMLVMALMMFALNKMVKKGFNPMIPPTLVKGFALFGSGYFKGLEYNPEIDEIYQITTSDKEINGRTSKEKKFLVGTAEPSLLAYYSGEVLKEEKLPIRLCGFSQCYRSEIGSYGKETKGLYRVHEFMKVEQVVICKADIEESVKLQDQMIKISEEIHQDLGLPYHLLQICTGDMGSGKYRSFDIEAWLPASKRWAETGSASNFLDWQARRLDVKYSGKDGKRQCVYMLNNTALPSPRPFIAILENFQQKDGSIEIPKVLQKYCGFKKIGK